MGVDVERFLDAAAATVARCRGEDGNLGRARPRLGEGWRAGPRQGLPRRDADRLRSLGRAAARRVDREAGQGLVPGSREPPTAPTARRRARLAGPYDLAAEFFRWEFATAVAGHVLGINPFDQPDVQAADKTNEVLAAGEPDVSRAARSTSCSPRRSEGDYVCIQAFVDPARENELAPLVERAARRAASSRRDSARATSTRPASCTRAARTRASSSRSSTTPATSCRFPAASSASAG